MLKHITKLAAAALLAVTAVFSASPALAADSIKGVNQNGYQEVVPVGPIASFQHTAGKLYYRTQFGSTTYYIEDANSLQLSTLQTKLSGNLAASTVSGWTYNLKNTKFTCTPSGTIVYSPGAGGSETIADSCTLWQTANNL